MNYRLCIFALASMAAPLCAQDAQSPPLPEGPLLKRTPDFSTWSVRIEDSTGDGEPANSSEAGGQSAGQKKSSLVRDSKVVKTGSTIVETVLDGQGRRAEVWHYRGIRVEKLPDASEPMILPGGGSAVDIYSIDFTKSDFAGLGWIAADRYAGMAKYNGRTCIVFKASVSPLSAQAQGEQASAIQDAIGHGIAAPDTVEVPAIAYIDLETRLPLLVTFGEQKRTYQYDAPPSAPLQLPPDLANAVKEYAKKIERLSAPPARP